MQEFKFDIKYRKNLNVDTLSHCRRSDPSDIVAVTIATSSTKQLHHHQQQDQIARQLAQALKTLKVCPKDRKWKLSPLHCYAQLWPQLLE